MSFYARVYVQTTVQAVHCSTQPIAVYALGPAGYDVFAVTFAGDYVASETLLSQLSIDAGAVVSVGPAITEQAQI